MLDDKPKTVPVLSFPIAASIGCTTKELVTSSECQAKLMDYICKYYPVGAVMNPMDLSVEAEAFGADIIFPECGAPEVLKGIIDRIDDADGIIVPEIGEARTTVFIDGIRKAKSIISDTPVICGVIGPFSLAGRLFDMTELMMECFENPDSVHNLLKKTACFIKDYISALKTAGADGVIIAEPAAGLLSKGMAEEFSSSYINEIFSCVNDDNFLIGYHNCGSSVMSMTESLSRLKADIYHFGNAICLKDILPSMPKSSIVMGNLDPLLLKTGNPDDVKKELEKIFDNCCSYNNFMISTGCDIPAEINLQNLSAYFESVEELYNQKAGTNDV